ncbi:MAG TPA: hypothetical protein VGD54_13395, partial [Steroidobacteraceae bacterium]
DNGLAEIRKYAERGEFLSPERPGVRHRIDITEAYVQHLLSYVDLATLKPLKVVVNAGNGGAGLVIDQLEAHLPFEFIKVHHQPDGHFPNGIPNPMLEENRRPTKDAILAPVPISALPGTATSTAAFCSMSRAVLSRGTTSSACSPRFCCADNPAEK